MITEFKQLTWKYLKSNKKRTLLTIIGIILSVALISSIGLFLKGIQEVEIESMKNMYGSYHVQYTNVDPELVGKVANHPKVSRSGTYRVGETFVIEDIINVSELVATDQALELLPYQPKEGRLPQKKGEVALEDWLLRNIKPNADIGDTIELGGKKYTLIGILENNINNQVKSEGMVLTWDEHLKGENAILLAEISPKTNLKTAVEDLKVLGTKDQVSINTYLLQAQGAGEESLYLGSYMVVGVIIAIVVISTIAVIYNSFQISVMERMKEIGLLRTVGATPKQIRKMILREATLLSLIGIPIGLFFGIIAIYSVSLAFRLIGGKELRIVKPVISPLVLGGSALIGLISIYISALLPAIFASRISPLVAISNRKSIAKEKIKRRKSPLIRKILGFEGEMAYKNIKRNPKRYHITLFSIIISVMLFISFKSYIDMASTITDEIEEAENVHFTVARNSQGIDRGFTIAPEIMEEIQNLSYVQEIYGIYGFYEFTMEINKNGEIEEIKGFNQEIYRDSDSKDESEINGTITVYDNAALEVSKKYAKYGNIDVNQLNSGNGIILLGKNEIYNPNTGSFYHGPVADLQVGDEIGVINRIYDENGSTKAAKVDKEVKVEAIVENHIFNRRGDMEGLNIIASKPVVENLIGQEISDPINLNIVLKSVEDEKEALTAIENMIKENPNLRLINHIDSHRNQKSRKLMVQILLYGIIIVVSLIGSVNIINTLTTNILLRKREFATLRSIGLTYKGLRKVIILEGMLYGVMGVIYGSIIGTALSFIYFQGFSDFSESLWNIPWISIGIAFLATLIIGYLLVQYPLARMKKDNSIDNIKGEY